MSVALTFSILFPPRAHKEKRRQKKRFYLARAIPVLPLSTEEELHKGPATYLSSEQAENPTYSLMIDVCLFRMTLILFSLTHLSSTKVCYSWRQWNFVSIKAEKCEYNWQKRQRLKAKICICCYWNERWNSYLSICSYILLKHYKTPWKSRC